MEILMPFVLSLLTAGAWFTALVAGSCVGDPPDAARRKVWFACSIVATQFVTAFAWIAGTLIR